MTEKGMTQKEKNIAEGMAFFLGQDLCAPFECPEGGCDGCPIHNVAFHLDKAYTALLSIPIIEG